MVDKNLFPYNLLADVEHFYLYNNESNDGHADYLRRLLNSI